MYECIESFFISVVDDDCFMTDKEKEIKKGTIWEYTDEVNYLGGEIHLQGRMKSMTTVHTRRIGLKSVKKHSKSILRR